MSIFWLRLDNHVCNIEAALARVFRKPLHCANKLIELTGTDDDAFIFGEDHVASLFNNLGNTAQRPADVHDLEGAANMFGICLL